jgi:hypothetical protein
VAVDHVFEGSFGQDAAADLHKYDSDVLSCSLTHPSVAGTGAHTQSIELQAGDVVQGAE